MNLHLPLDSRRFCLSVCLSSTPKRKRDKKRGANRPMEPPFNFFISFYTGSVSCQLLQDTTCMFFNKMFFSLGVPAEVACTEGELMTASAMSVTIAKRVIDFFYVLQGTTRLENLRKMAKMINQRSFRYVKYSIAKCIFGLF